MSDYWTHELYDDALYACWAADEDVTHCRTMIEPFGLDAHPAPVVLDFGCGVGRLLFPFAEAHPNVWWVGVDTNPMMLQHAKATRSASPHPPRVVELVDRIPEYRFAAAYSMLVFQHMPPVDVAASLTRICEVLEPGARFRFQFVPFGDAGEHNYPLSRGALGTMLGMAGFAHWSFGKDDKFETWLWCTAMKGNT